MDLKNIDKILLNNIDRANLQCGKKYYKDGYVKEVKYTHKDKYIDIKGQVISDESNDIYKSSIVFDIENKSICDVYCTCNDFEEKNNLYDITTCKHVLSVVYNIIDLLESQVISNLKQNTIIVKNNNMIKRSEDFIKKDFLDSFKNNPKEKINLDINLEYIGQNTIISDFKIGIDKMYVLKNLREFSDARINCKDLVFGVDFVYNPISSIFDEDDIKIIEMIEEYGMNIPRDSLPKDLRTMTLRGSNIRRVFESLKYRSFDFKFRNMHYNPSIINSNLPVKLELDIKDSKFILKSKDYLPYPLSQKGDVVFYQGDIYLLSEECGYYYKKIYNILNNYKEICFDKEEITKILTDVIPKLELIVDQVHVDDRIVMNISKDLQVKYYFDLEDDNITCRVEFYYEGENKGKYIIRDTQKEEEAIYRLYTNYFEPYKDKYIFKGNDNQLYDFLSVEINRLKYIGEVYYSDKLKEKRIYNSSSFKVELGEEFNKYLEFDFQIEGVDESEYLNIINAFKSNKRFYKLGNGNFINLEESETRELFKLMESLGFTENFNNMKVNTNKALFIENLLREKKLPFINGTKNLNKTLENFKKINEKEVEIPKNLNASLRDYQISSLNWFNTIDTLGFGGILADEMGLGKTLQTISFLLSRENSKTLVITPTALIYNWKDEIEKFAPSMKVGLIHGIKKDRINIINNIEDYDVLLTTYGSLRNDIEKYDNISFDYCIIDEAQNIKNPLASSTNAVKGIKAKTRFALTGTPIENNLLELWSIFDFIMPGYLYTLTKFSAIFIKDESNINNLKTMIKPFILRRTKSQVIKELPEKIERKYFVEMGQTQKNVYGVYAKDVKKKLEDKKDIKNKITVFSYLTKLRQLCLDPSVVMEDYKGKSAKIEACLDIIEDYIKDDNKILIFSQFTSVLKNMGEKLDKNNINYLYIDGSTKSQERIRLVNEFNESKDKKVFLISLKAGGYGINLTSANTVIHLDPWWNPAVEDQASDRAHRYGQRRVVEVIKLIAKGTIEEKIIELQESKRSLINDMIDGSLSNSNLLKTLSEEDILNLFK